VKEIIHRYDQIATEYGTEILVAPARAGSHVITLVGPLQQQLPTFNTFAEAAEAVIGLSPDMVQAGQSLEDHTLSHAADLTAATLGAVRQLMGALSRLKVDAAIELSTGERSASVRIQREAAGAIDRLLKDVEQQSVLLRLEGVIRGFTALAGQFEIEVSNRVYRGTVPTAMRAAADGIPLGSAVQAEIEEITTTFRSGDQRVRYRLQSISGLDGRGTAEQAE
jgi:hypothetical protein